MIYNSLNPVAKPIGIEEVVETIDVFSLIQFMNFCRTYNIPWDVNTYTQLSRSAIDGYEFIEEYLEHVEYDEKEVPEKDVWQTIDEEWKKVKRYDQIMAKVKPIRENFLDRSKIKWSGSFTFEEYIQLEDIYVNVIKAYNVTDPIRQDAIKKAAIMSIKLNRAMEGENFKDLKDGLLAYKSLLEVADIKSLSDFSNSNTLVTMSDLYAFMERNGFKFKFHDGTPRDIVDFAIKNINDSLYTSVVNVTGLTDKLRVQKEKYEKLQDDIIEEEAKEEFSIEEIEKTRDHIDEENLAIDEELAEEDLDMDDMY